ncbi:MAG: hypothetical protein KY476_07850 [Planctomycetes bacterium]|nr:hypothetical protein [Planctomycetota bacterium]
MTNDQCAGPDGDSLGAGSRSDPGIEYDDSPITIDEQRELLRWLGPRIGWDDPEMDVYDELDPRRNA